MNDVLDILKKCGAPFSNVSLTSQERKVKINKFMPLPNQNNWGKDEALLVLKCLCAPLLLHSANDDKSSKLDVPLSFARLFAQAPHAMIHALPKIEQHLNRANKSPEFAAAFEAGGSWEFWNKNANDLAKALTTPQTPQTARTIEKARARVRKSLKTISP